MSLQISQTEKPTEEIIDFLDKTVLGSRGARYRHADTRNHIHAMDNPLYFCLHRNDKLLANVTFCRRNIHWYVRYLSFHPFFQSSKPQSKLKRGALNSPINEFFVSKLSSNQVQSFYAYIDPDNIKSLELAIKFGFQKIGEVLTQTYSRMNPEPSPRLKKETYQGIIKEKILQEHGHLKYFFEAQLENGNFYSLKNKQGELIAVANIHNAHWEWKRLPGKFGKAQIKALPYIPGLNKLFNPNDHRFLVIDSLWIKDNDPEILEELLNGILAEEKYTSLIWWVHSQNKLYANTKKSIKWGLLHLLNGSKTVNLMALTSHEMVQDEEHYINGLDFI